MRTLKILFTGILTILLVGSATGLLAQSRPYEGPDDPAGDIAAEREGYMNGNRVLLYFQNTTELAFWSAATATSTQWSRWPNNYQGTRMLDGLALLIGARVYLDNNTPVTDINEIHSRTDLDTLYYLQTSYREEMDTDPTGQVEWGLYPVFGYFNELSDYPAMSNKPNSWPPSGWPSVGGTTKWPGEWNGRFGRGVNYADLETYFVANDAQDQEYLGPEDQVKYFPRPGKKIGDVRPNVTIQKGDPWGGIGIRVEVRGFQWNNPQARDAIFWEYTIANISDYDLPEVAFGYWVDNGIGGDAADDEWGFFDTKLDLAYSWDNNALGASGLTPGIMGFAYLESPGLAYDGIDNDQDGLIDEKRDNQAVSKIGPTDGIANLQDFLDFYNLKESDLKEHWDADEDQDWEDGEDLNGNGVYDLNEFAGDDVGLDGVGPGELNYNGPDEGECNHKPDFREGVGCEPNFDFTDVTESDMVGLTSFRLFPIQSHASDHWWFRGDRSMWELVGQDSLVEFSGSIANLVEVFASGPFPLYKGLTERISMSELHAYDALAGLQSEEHTAPALYQEKKIVQVIYEKDYRFAQPPRMPTLTATPGDGQVILTWDNVADTKTRDPFMGNVNDFQGYKLYRSTDKKMSDPEIITDGYGTPTLKKPIFECDIIDGLIGFADYGMINGVGYYLGTDNGITHYFVDNTVQNGRTYYYAIVAYDSGAASIGPGISPSENKIIIDLDESENVIGVGKNVQIVVPHQPAAGYVADEVKQSENSDLLGTGTVTPEILAKGNLKKNHEYKIKFDVDSIQVLSPYELGVGLRYTDNGFRIYDVTDGNQLVYQESPDNFAYRNIVYDDSLNLWHINTQDQVYTDVFDGLRLKITLPDWTASFDRQNSGWITGDTFIRVIPSVEESEYYPWDYVIEFTGDTTAYTGRTTNKTGIRDENGERVDRNSLFTEQNYSFRVWNTSFVDSTGNYGLMDMVGMDVNGDGIFNIFDDKVLVGVRSNSGRWGGTVFVLDFNESAGMPASGDKYAVKFQRPFYATDSLMFHVVSHDSLDKEGLKNTMDNIQVVPNPYVATNAMESAVANTALNQRRQIMFTHIPANCDIKIFTVSGVLVDEMEVHNAADNGIAHWDLQTREGLEIAAGMYVYYIKSTVTGEERMGKFAIIK